MNLLFAVNVVIVSLQYNFVNDIVASLYYLLLRLMFLYALVPYVNASDALFYYL